MLLAVAHRAVKTAKYGIPYLVNFYIQWSAARKVLFEVPINCAIKIFYNTVIIRSVCLWLCIHGERD